ncbi:DUF5412 domain-containing protein [Romboutsia lituseburensis]|uniref:DUF5412 domain-containing protein n=1 Tax=Romboutsia lituseburensis TaxID=1537 RepID=UPI00215AFC11|nr:DUF5412 domain-containing protein [Romboutsia lituseburensis]MCR8744323.1 DUF5412 domain-containing protein [Romboutsia lituseburensis]
MKKKHIKSLIIVALIFSTFIYLNVKSHEVLSRKSINIIEEIYSPNGEYKSVVFLDGGSATVSNNIRVAVVKNSKKRIYDSDVIFFQDKVSSVDIKWISDTELVINYYNTPYNRILDKIENIDDINIIYKETESNF